MFSLEGISEDVAQYMKSSERLLSALTRHTRLTEVEKDMILYYSREVLTRTQSQRNGPEKQSP